MDLQDTLQTIRRKVFSKRYALETELTGLRDEHAHVIAELDGVRGELSQTREQDARQLVNLQQQLFATQTERKTAQDHVQLLESSLANADARQQGAEQQIHSLESKLDDARSQHEASVGQTQDALLHLQSEQQNLLTLQTDLAKTFHEVGKQMLASAQTRTPQPRLPLLQTAAMAVLLFLSGALLSGLVMRNTAPAVDLTPLHDSVVDLQQLMRIHIESYDELLKILKESLNRETAGPEESSVSPEAMVIPQRLLERQRADLAQLGFEATEDIDATLAQFRSLYLPAARGKPEPPADEVDTVLGYYADLARKDSEKYRLDSDVLAAIRLASKRTGVEFAYLMELAATESSFNPAAKAATSTAVGLYQFKEDTWLDTIKVYGHKYGLDAIKKRIVYTVGSNDVRQPTINDPDQLAAALDLRLQPRLAALLAGEHVRRNTRQLLSTLDRKPGRTDLYLTHFFGTSGAISFLKALAEDPQKIATDIFPGPAKRNRSIFQNKARKQRTVGEIYKLFARKFNTDRFRDGGSG